MLWPNSAPDRWYLTVCLDVNWCWQAVPPNHILSAQWGKSECQKFSHPGIKNHALTVTHTYWHYLPPKQLLRATPAFPIAFCRWDDARSSACRGPGSGAGTPGSSKCPKIMCRFKYICRTISTCLNSFYQYLEGLYVSIHVYTPWNAMPLYSHPPTSSPEKMGSNCCKGTGFIPAELFMVSQDGPPNNKQVYIITLFTTVISSWTF